MPPKGSKKKVTKKVEEESEEVVEVEEPKTTGKRTRTLSNASEEDSTKKSKVDAEEKEETPPEAEEEPEEEVVIQYEEDVQPEPVAEPEVEAEPEVVVVAAAAAEVTQKPIKATILGGSNESEVYVNLSPNTRELLPATLITNLESIVNEDGTKISINIPNKDCGMVIGPGGKTISAIQKACGAKVQLDQTGEPRKLEISGDADACRNAENLVNKIIVEGGQVIHPNAMKGGPLIKEIIECEPDYVGRVIGKGGENIKEIQTRTGAKINVHQDGCGPTQPRKIELTGTLLSIKDCVELLKWVISNGPRLPPLIPGQYGYVAPQSMSMPQQNPYGAPMSSSHNASGSYGLAMSGQLPGVTLGSPTGPGSVAVIVDCPKEYCGRVIGKGGETIKTLERTTGARIQVDQNVPAGAPCKVNIAGAEANVSVAINMVQDVMLNGSGTGQPGGPGNRGGGNQYGAPQGQYGAPQGHYGAPQSQYGAPQSQYGAPQSQYGAPQGQYGASQGQYGASQGQYGASQGHYGGAPQQQQRYGGAPQQQHYGGAPQQQQHQSYGQQQQQYGAPAPAAQAYAPPANNGLPPGWEAHKDPNTGNMYYHNKATSTTQWDKPV
jgi:predicted RNA-binding protein YlqC (UPF0109 family)